jgi:hypothetical protein
VKKVLISTIRIGLAIAVLLSIRLASAEAAGGLPLAKFAGNYAGEGSATFAVCFNSDFSAVADCSTAPNSAFFSQTVVFQGTGDKSGNSCTTITVTNGPEFPNPPLPANMLTFIQVGTVTSYNQATESGQQSFTIYAAGSGTSCNGSVLVNTGNAPIAGNSTGSFVVSQKGTRIDAVTLTSQNSPVADLADYVGHSVAFKQ